MPSRVIREGLLESAAVSELDDSTQLFYIRLMLIVDDYGRYQANPVLLLAKMFPLQVDRWSPSRVGEALSTLGKTPSSSGNLLTSDGKTLPLVSIYEVNGKKYLQINNFEQKLRRYKAIFPAPVGELPSVDGETPEPNGHLTADSDSDSDSERILKGKESARSADFIAHKQVSVENGNALALLDPNLTEREPGFWAQRMYDRHPKKTYMNDATAEVLNLFRKGGVELLRAIDIVHEARCDTQEWKAPRENGRFIQPLGQWLRDRGWTQEQFHETITSKVADNIRFVLEHI